MQEEVKAIKMLTFFNTLEEKDKDIVIAMTESLVERNQGNKKYDSRNCRPGYLVAEP